MPDRGLPVRRGSLALGVGVLHFPAKVGDVGRLVIELVLRFGAVR